MAQLKFEIIVSRLKETIEETLERFTREKDAHSLMVLGFCYDGSYYHVLVRYREK